MCFSIMFNRYTIIYNFRISFFILGIEVPRLLKGCFHRDTKKPENKKLTKARSELACKSEQSNSCSLSQLLMSWLLGVSSVFEAFALAVQKTWLPLFPIVCSLADAVKATLILAGSWGHRTNMTGQLSFSQKYFFLVLFTNGSPHFGQLTIFNT